MQRRTLIHTAALAAAVGFIGLPAAAQGTASGKPRATRSVCRGGPPTHSATDGSSGHRIGNNVVSRTRWRGGRKRFGSRSARRPDGITLGAVSFHATREPVPQKWLRPTSFKPVTLSAPTPW